MVIGTVRIEEARAYDSEAGFHQFKDESGEEYGSFEVFWSDGELTPDDQDCEPDALADMTDEERLTPGWYWHACFPGCLPDGEPSGPFARSSQAKADALEEDEDDTALRSIVGADWGAIERNCKAD